jgi:hypothetical protein
MSDFKLVLPLLKLSTEVITKSFEKDTNRKIITFLVIYSDKIINPDLDNPYIYCILGSKYREKLRKELMVRTLEIAPNFKMFAFPETDLRFTKTSRWTFCVSYEFHNYSCTDIENLIDLIKKS